MDTEILDILESIIKKHKQKEPFDEPVEKIKQICNSFALEKTDEDILDYTMMLDLKINPYDFRMLMIEIYESL
jgi:hypothetical protein